MDRRKLTRRSRCSGYRVIIPCPGSSGNRKRAQWWARGCVHTFQRFIAEFRSPIYVTVATIPLRGRKVHARMVPVSRSARSIAVRFSRVTIPCLSPRRQGAGESPCIATRVSRKCRNGRAAFGYEKGARRRLDRSRRETEGKRKGRERTRSAARPDSRRRHIAWLSSQVFILVYRFLGKRCVEGYLYVCKVIAPG